VQVKGKSQKAKGKRQKQKSKVKNQRSEIGGHAFCQQGVDEPIIWYMGTRPG
jgi:hypothetical protein